MAEFPFMAVHHAAARDTRLTQNEKLVLLILLDRADARGVCFPGLSDIAACTGLSRSTVKRARAGLQEVGVLRWSVGGTDRSNTYAIQDPQTWDLSGRSTRTPGPHRTRVHTDPRSTRDPGPHGPPVHTGPGSTQTLPRSTQTPPRSTLDPEGTHEGTHEGDHKTQRAVRAVGVSPPRAKRATGSALSDPATREAVDAVHRVLTEAGVTGLDTRWWAAACKVAHGLLNAKRPTPAATIVAAARWAMDAKQAKYHAGRLLRPGGIRELVQLYEATAMNDGLDWTGVPPELEASYRTPSHHLSQGQVDVLKTPREPSEVIAVGLPGPQTSGHPP